MLRGKLFKIIFFLITLVLIIVLGIVFNSIFSDYASHLGDPEYGGVIITNPPDTEVIPEETND